MQEKGGTVFESFVNSERCKTLRQCRHSAHCLRALLIQKDVKRTCWRSTIMQRLRALLIQKDVKLQANGCAYEVV